MGFVCTYPQGWEGGGQLAGIQGLKEGHFSLLLLYAVSMGIYLELVRSWHSECAWLQVRKPLSSGGWRESGIRVGRAPAAEAGSKGVSRGPGPSTCT